jgi:hypothetical protein
MIECEVYESGKEDKGLIGDCTMQFNELPREDDILWLLVHDKAYGSPKKQLRCRVVFSAQFASHVISYNKGYVIVAISNSTIVDVEQDKALRISKLQNIEEFNIFLSRLNDVDKKLMIVAMEKLNNYSFVTNIKYEKRCSPTIIVTLSHVDRENEKAIWSIEYWLLRKSTDKFYVDIEFA